jgi:hypothetical protein
MFNKSTKNLAHYMLLTPGLDNGDGDEKPIFATTNSNSAGLARLVSLPSQQVLGSTMRIVRKAFADKLPKRWQWKGRSFLTDEPDGPKSLKNLPSDITATDELVLVHVPNAFPIHPGVERVFKGPIDDALLNAFHAHHGDMGKFWLLLQADLDEMIIPHDYNHTCVAIIHGLNKRWLPFSTRGPPDWTKHQYVEAESPPMEIEDDDIIQAAFMCVQTAIEDCKRGNNSLFVSSAQGGLSLAPAPRKSMAKTASINSVDTLTLNSRTAAAAAVLPSTAAVIPVVQPTLSTSTFNPTDAATINAKSCCDNPSNLKSPPESNATGCMTPSSAKPPPDATTPTSAKSVKKRKRKNKLASSSKRKSSAKREKTSKKSPAKSEPAAPPPQRADIENEPNYLHRRRESLHC